MTALPECRPAHEQLLDLAAETRPDIRRDQLHGAIIACHTAGWTWTRTLVAVAMMLAHGDEPRDLLAASADPLKARGTRHRPASDAEIFERRYH